MIYNVFIAVGLGFFALAGLSWWVSGLIINGWRKKQ